MNTVEDEEETMSVFTKW